MPKENRGFARMDPSRQKEVASRGGTAAHESGKAHEFTQEEARLAGRKGGLEAHRRRRERKAAAEAAEDVVLGN